MSEPTFPSWLHGLAIVSLAVAFICAGVIVWDEFRRPQRMWIMNLVWPLTALFGSVVWLAFYLAWGREAARAESMPGKQAQADDRKATKPPFPVMVAKASSHCGAGCTLGDIVAEWLAFAVPAVAIIFGWKSLFADKIFAVWVLDFVLAFLFGIIFQYFTIKPMRNLSPKEAIVEALKADAASISAWQIGMYGFMAVGQFVWLKRAYGETAGVDTPEFWFLMQLAMVCGFATSFPVNWLLLRMGVKEEM